MLSGTLLPLIACLSYFYFDGQVFDGPLQGLFVRVEINVQPFAADDPASVQYLDRLRIVVAGDYQFGAERKHLVGGHKFISMPDLMATGGYAVTVFAAALPA